MPLIMDEDMDVDINDLFDDGAELSLPSSPPPKELFQRIDELRGSGACQGLAWSRWGIVVSILPSGTGLGFRSLRCHPYDGSWDLSEPTDFPLINVSLDGGPLQHVCWSPNGSDLAVFDASGRVMIFTMTMSLNKPSLAKNGLLEAAEDLHAVVGTYWLNLMPAQRAPVIYSYATKAEKEYRYEMTQAISYGPCHPNPMKSALVCLTTNGVLRLFWLQNDNKWHETTHEIESIVSSNDLITHASICADKNSTLLIAFATTTKQLRTVRVAIRWGNNPNDKAPHGASIRVNPSIMVAHLTETNWMDVSSTDGGGYPSQSSMAVLSHLEILPPSPDAGAGHPTLPTIVTVRSYLPGSPSHFNQNMESVIDRWELRESAQSIHPAFEQLSSRRGSTGSQIANAVSLRKTDGFTVNKVVINVQLMALDRIICFAYSDGSFEYRDRITLTETYMDSSIDRFSHISQVGFSYSDEEPCLQAVLSPTTCSFIQLGINGKFKWKAMSHHSDDLGLSQDDGQYAAVIAGLTMACSNAVMGSVNYDDLLALTHKYTSQSTFSYDWLTEVAKVLRFHVDYSEESHHDTLIRNPSIQLCLSIQNSLGYNGDVKPRSFGAKLAWLSLQIRNCVVLMTMASSMKFQDPDNIPNKISSLEDADAVRLLSGTVRWCLDLMSWLVDCLLHPEDEDIFKSFSTGSAIDLSDLNSRLHASNNIALHMLLSSATRGFLTAICRRLSHLDYTARKAMQTAAQFQATSDTKNPIPQPVMSTPLRNAYTQIATQTNTSTIQIRNFESFLTSISAAVKEAYTTAGLASAPQPQPNQPQSRNPTESGRNSVEQKMLFGGDLPAALLPAMSQLFTTLLPSLRTGIDPANLFFHDFSLLAVEPFSNSWTHTMEHTRSKSTRDAKAAHTIDVFRRVPITLGKEGEVEVINGGLVGIAALNIVAPASKDGTKGTERKWRRCVRCAAVMEDLSSSRPAVQFLIVQQRRCFCSGYWVVMAGGQIVI